MSEKNEQARVRIAFYVAPDEAKKLCDIRCEPKPTTAAAQIVRKAIKEACNDEQRHDA